MRCLTLLILIMRGLMDLFRRRPVWAGASAPPGTGPASARAPKLRCAPSRLASRPCRQGRPGSGRMAVPCRTQRTGGPVSADSRRRSTRTPSKHHRAHPARTPYHHSARPSGLAPTGLCTASRQDYAQQRETPAQQFKIAQIELARPMSSVVIDVGTRRSACSAVERVARRESGRDLPPLVARHLVGHAVEASLHVRPTGMWTT